MHKFDNPILRSRCGARRKAVALAVVGLFAGAAGAQQVLPTVTVTGQADSLDSALDVQQAADNIVSVVHADAIGKLPDTNAAEAVQRLPGVSVERDQGEGRYVRVRGLGPDLNAVTINGSLVPSPEAERRAVALDIIPAGLIQSLEVTKTLTPDQDANSLGGTVEVKTVSAFDRPGRFASVEAGVSHDGNTDRNGPNFGASWSDRLLDGKLGVSAGLSYDKRKFGSDNVETGGAWDGDALESFEQRDYLITRERKGGAVNFDLRPGGGQSYFLRTLYSSFRDQEVRQAHTVEFDDAQAVAARGDAESAREVRQREETLDIASVVLGTEQSLGAWKLSAALGVSRAEEDTPEHLSGATFEGNDDFTEVGFGNSRQPKLRGPDDLYDPSQYTLAEGELSRQRVTDREHNLRLDLARSLEIAGLASEIKFGAKASRREKRSDEDVWTYDEDLLGQAYDEARLSLANFTGGTVSYPYGRYGPSISPGSVRSLLRRLNRSEAYDEEASRINDFTIEEDIDAAYAQGSTSVGLWRLLVGLRYEHTDLSARGTGVLDGEFVRNRVERSYDNLLPALHVRRDLDSDTSIRAAWTNSVVRPTFGQLAPGFEIDGDEAQFGNPELDPLESSNFDLGIERRLGYAGAVSAYVFHKQIKNFVYSTDLAGSGRWADFDEAVTFDNGDDAHVTGVELSWSQSLRGLPAPWNGLLASVNATFSDSSAEIARYDADLGRRVRRDIPLPSQSDRVVNLTLGYEAGGLSLRLAANYKSAYLLEVGDAGSSANDLYVDDQTQVDFSVRYALTRGLELVFEALNLNDEAYYVYQDSQRRNAQFESYGTTYKIGLKATLF